MKLLVHRPCSWGVMQSKTCTWISSLSNQLASVSDDYRLAHYETGTSRIAIGRNNAAAAAIRGDFDYLLMIDPDMEPDLYVGDPRFPLAEKFIESSLWFLKDNPVAIVGAPATLSDGTSNVRIFHGSEDEARRSSSLLALTDSEVAERVAEPRMERVSAIGTGLAIVPVEVFRRVESPWFADIYDDEISTLLLGQDYRFCLHCGAAGVPAYANWFSFSGHWQYQCLGIPGIDLIDDATIHTESALDEAARQCC